MDMFWGWKKENQMWLPMVYQNDDRVIDDQFLEKER